MNRPVAPSVPTAVPKIITYSENDACSTAIEPMAPPALLNIHFGSFATHLGYFTCIWCITSLTMAVELPCPFLIAFLATCSMTFSLKTCVGAYSGPTSSAASTATTIDQNVIPNAMIPNPGVS
eukprot:CAMPEP_0180278796 /NCGR_PEP_ID=MMETSP0988-20121125/7692_1 /TAXON_ID=697907 /ORGANISM="non described non described, Strain CCMP2293" /LENGTH=122 /DNA_ID=CAMNT_0022250403 /DNA_START=720 /DNA_END=1084 /DNA_ORIENTATION=-